jgi:hypothetical protein
MASPLEAFLMAQAQRDEERRAEQSANQLRRDAEERQYREQQAEAQARCCVSNKVDGRRESQRMKKEEEYILI